MIIFITDLINTVLQSILLSYITYYFVFKTNKTNYVKIIMVAITLFLSIHIVINILGNTTIAATMGYVTSLGIIGLFYRKNYKKALIAYNLIYIFMQINMLIFGSIYFGHIRDVVPSEYVDVSLIISVYLPQIIMTYFIFKYKEKVDIIYKDILIRKYSLLMVLIIVLAINYITIYSWMVSGNDNPLFKDIIIISLVAFVLVIATYFANIQKRIKETTEINKLLDGKVNELKKVKHDYGAQISYLYGLHLMGRHDRLGELLKDIINGNNSVMDAVELSNNSDSIITIVMREAVAKGINVIVDDTVDVDDIIMSELEFQKVISNLVNNSIRAVDGSGLITARTYKRIDKIIIKIQNNGPKIEDDIIYKIFDLGFSTKGNSDNGFGLAIVKESVEKYKGNIKVQSTNEFTEFKISLPIKIKKQ